MNEVNDFKPQKKEITLTNGLKIIISTPTLGWWYEFLIPKMRELQGKALDPELRKMAIKDMKEGAIKGKTLAKVPMPILDLLLELIIYYVKRDKAYCFEQLQVLDFLAIINTFLEVLDIKRAMHFFEEFSQHLPLMNLVQAAGMQSDL